MNCSASKPWALPPCRKYGPLAPARVYQAGPDEICQINGGVVVEAAKNLTLAAVVRTPYTKEADSRSRLSYDSPHGNTKIDLEASARNTYKQPLVVGAGMSVKISETLAIALDISYFDWSSYSVDYYEEELDRDFKNIVKIGGGIEYIGEIRLFRQDFELPLRAGVSYDPQPMAEPDSAYLYFSFGTGVHWKKIFLDMGTLVGGESGSGNSLRAKKLTLSLSFRM